MEIISPRLNQILRLLLESESPISVDQLSRELGVSRRTVFRELENVDSILKKTKLELNTKIGEGIFLIGDNAGRNALKDLLGLDMIISPHNVKDRREVLIFLLMDAGETQKLYYYARILGVSEATVSMDLDSLEDYFNSFGVEIKRRQGQGIEIAGSEENIRRILADTYSHIHNIKSFIKKYGYPNPKILIEIKRLYEEEWLLKLDWMTDESINMLIIHLAIMTERVIKRRELQDIAQINSNFAVSLEGTICDSIEIKFSIKLSLAERASVGVFIRAGRAKKLSPLDITDSAAFNDIQNLVYRMIDSFDPDISHVLKLNEDLVSGLSLHMWSGIIRLKQGIELDSSMKDQLLNDFPEVFEKSRRAAAVIEREYRLKVPDSEVAFIASHFGAAIMHLGERKSRKLVQKAGIICVEGIGVSYMMASQVRQRFRGALDVIVSDWNNPEEWKEYDMLISSAPLKFDGCPVIIVKPILENDHYEAIRKVINQQGAKMTENTAAITGALPEILNKLSNRISEIEYVLRGFNAFYIHADCSFDELAKKTGYRYGSRPESGNEIYQDILKRESIATQIISQLKIILLHVKTKGVERPAVGLIVPEGGTFTNPYFQNSEGCLVMLVPQGSSKDLLEAFGYVSSALIEDGVLLASIQSGDEALAYTRIEAALIKYLRDFWSENLDNKIY